MFGSAHAEKGVFRVKGLFPKEIGIHHAEGARAKGA